MMNNASWTDWFFLCLLCGVVVAVLWSLKNEQNRRSFQILFSQKLAVSAGMILSVFFFVAVLDCVHVSDASNLGGEHTLLDAVLSPLDQIQEKTFSAPLALAAYTTEIHWADGHYESVYPQLRYPAKTLSTVAARNQFVWRQLGIALCAGLLAAGVLWGGGACYAKSRFGCSMQEKNEAFIAAWMTLGALVFLLVLSVGLSRQLHVLGTGKIGQDIFYYAVKSIRTGLVIGVLTTLFTLPFALFLGVAAGYFGGWIDDVIQYTYTTLSSIPGVLLITASVLSMQTFIANHPTWFETLMQQADARLLALCLILGVTSWTSLCRLLRADAMRLKHMDYVLAAQVLGVSSYKILRTHLLPNVMHIVMITLVLDFSYLILAEALLTYVGVGVAPMTMSWGNMINSARLELARDPVVWWPVFSAFIFMFTFVLASNVFADAVETAWNPRMNLA